MVLLRRLIGPGPTAVAFADAGRTAIGVMLALAFTSVVDRLVLTGRFGLEPMLVLPLAASATLVFAIPASPLAQPRAIIGGNLISGLAGISVALVVGHPLLGGLLGAGLAIAAMLLTRTLHPPGGSIGFAAGMAGASLATYGETLAPIAVCSILVTLAAAAFARLTGRSYPHRAAATPSPHGTADVQPGDRVGFVAADVDKALAQYGELLDVSREDLDVLFRQVELQAHRRIHARILCGEIMSRDVLAVAIDSRASEALAFLAAHDLRTAPVVDREGGVAGLVRRAELLVAGDASVAEVLEPRAHQVRADTAVEALLPLLSSGTSHEVLVIDDTSRLIGVITQTDLLAVLYRAHIVEAVAG